MGIIFAVPAFIFLFSLASSQTLISSTLPACVQQCPILQEAQAGCIPPAALVTDQSTYQSCFCQSAFLTSLAANPSSICPTCPPVDLTTLQTWFTGFCTAGAPLPTSTTSSTSSSPTTTVPTAASPGPTTQNTAGESTISDETPPDNRGWIHSHWRWVLMLIILFFGFGILAWAGWYLHRRYHRLHDSEAMMTSATSAPRQPDLETWGPGQSVHDFGAGGGGIRPPVNEKGKGSVRPDAVVQQQPPPRPQPPPQQNPEKEKGSRRLKKVLLAGRG